MHEFIETPSDILALKVSGRITGEDLDPIMDRLDSAFEQHKNVHVFVETKAIGALELSALPHYFSRAFPLFGKLSRFGRVAVVADQAWIRVGTRIESAVLPFITYRVYEPNERDDALRWVLTGEDSKKD